MTRSLLALLVVAPAAAADKARPPGPADGTVFRLAPDAPKYATADVEFRDPADAKWPNFFYGKPAAAGSLTWSAKGPQGAFTLLCDKMAQKNGDQSRRVLADILTGNPPAVTFSFQEGGPLKPGKDAKGKGADTFPVRGELAVGAKKATVAGTASARFTYPKGGREPEAVHLAMTFEVPGSDLGLKSAVPVRVQVGAVAFREPKKK